ncbi:hypothetical protein ATCC51561_949 [Campylobacter concisus ATCC 51561]|nr:hypothetical protein ATCC51561_949 [Campylobacter concisus ATCC 51561]
MNICSLNLANFNLCLAEFNHFGIARVSALLKFDQVNVAY